MRRRKGPRMNPGVPISLEVLAQRQANTDHAVQQLQTQFSSSFGKLESQIQQIADRMSAQARPQWQLLATIFVTLVSLVGVGWGLGTRPIVADIARQQQSIDKLDDALAALASTVTASAATMPQAYISRQEYQDARVIFRQDNAARQSEVDNDLKVLGDQIKAVDDALVPRGEHEERWRSQEAATANVREQAEKEAASLQRQIDEVKESLGGIYGARDVIRDLQARMDRLEVGKAQ